MVTTGVYCRPTCPARKAHSANIRLHDTLEAARATGFRACARCTPEGLSLQDRRRRLVQTVCRIIEAPDHDPSSCALAASVGLSASHLHRVFRRETGMTPQSYARARRGAGSDENSGAAEEGPSSPGHPTVQGRQ